MWVRVVANLLVRVQLTCHERKGEETQRQSENLIYDQEQGLDVDL